MFVKNPRKFKTYSTTEKIEQRLVNGLEFIAEYLDLQIKMDKTFNRTTDRPDEAFNLITVFHDPKTGLEVKFDYSIPFIEKQQIIVKGIRRFIQKQLRDLLFIITPKNAKVLLGDLFITVTTKVEAQSVQNSIYLIAKYLNPDTKLDELVPYVNEFQQHKKLLEENNNDAYKALSKIITRNKVDKLLTLIDIYSKLYPVWKDYASTIDELFYMAFLMKHANQDKKKELDLATKLLRKEDDFIFDTYIFHTLSRLLDAVFITKNKKKKKQYKFDPWSYLYEFILIDTFNAPLATLSDMNRVTILGNGSYLRSSVPIHVRNLHESHYGNLDPCVTPDRENAGIVLYLAQSAELDEFGRFKPLVEKSKRTFQEWTQKGLENLIAKGV